MNRILEGLGDIWLWINASNPTIYERAGWYEIQNGWYNKNGRHYVSRIKHNGKEKYVEHTRR